LATENKNLSKTDGKKRTNIKGIANLDDAFFAGSKKSKDCTLILTEGLSAATFAISGLSVVGREYYGVFPLKGKILNTKDASIKKISENEEITNIKKIVGLENGKEYTSDNFNDLRYGKIMILSDQDRDGSHIKGTLFNLTFRSCIQFVSYIMAKFIEIQGFYGINAYTDYKSKKAKKGDFILFSSRLLQLERYRKNVEYIYDKIFQGFGNFYSKRCQGIFHRNEECELYLE
jgi:DNA topoisomerase-2